MTNSRVSRLIFPLPMCNNHYTFLTYFDTQIVDNVVLFKMADVWNIHIYTYVKVEIPLESVGIANFV